MAKTSKTTGPSREGGLASNPGDNPVLVKGDRLVVLDGAIGFSPGGGAPPDLWLRRGDDGLLEGGGAGPDPWVFNVQDYGALGDGVTDDLAAVNLAVTAAVAYGLAQESRYAEVYFPVGVYVLAGATTKGGPTLGNAQIPLPIVAGTARKLTLVFRGAGADAAALAHWQQTTGQRWGVTLKCTLTGLVSDGTHGAPSVIGGPTPSHGYGTVGGANGFNNLLVVIDGIAVQAPLNPTVIAYDFRGIAEVSLPNASAIVDATPAQMLATPATTEYSSGVLMPQNLNNHYSFIGSLSVEGFYLGMSVTEHLSAQRIAIIYSHDGVYVQADGAGNHASSIQNLGVEVSTNGIYTDGNPTHGPIGIDIAMYDCEAVTNHIVDANGALCGRVNFVDNDETKKAPTIAAGHARNLDVVAVRQPRGPVTAPAVPLTTVALRNPFYRDADVLVVGGTVTQVSIDAITTGLISGFFRVPSGASIAITYSVAPTWKWWVR